MTPLQCSASVPPASQPPNLPPPPPRWSPQHHHRHRRRYHHTRSVSGATLAPARAMARSRRSHPLLVPLALTVTAFAATAGLWFLSDKGSPSRDYSYESGLSSDEDPRQSSSRRRRARLGDLRDRRRGREHDRITEEDTEDLEEERRREESLRRGRGERERVRGELTMSPEATAVMGATSVMDLPDAPTPPHPGSFPVDVGPELTEVPPVPEGRYIPPPPPKRKVAIVLSERRALTGHDSDEDFEEAGLPSVSAVVQIRLLLAR